MWSSRVRAALLGLAFVTAAAAAGDESVRAVLERSQGVMRGEEAPERELQGIARPEDVRPLDDPGFLTGRGSLSAERIAEPTTAQQRAWNAMIDEAESADQAAESGPPRPIDPQDVLYVFISLGMPERALRELFAEASRRPDLQVVFLLRGWTPPDLNGLVGRLNRLLPELERPEDVPPVRIDPVEYREAGIVTVPTFRRRTAAGEWTTLLGTTSLADAVEKLEAGQYAGRAFGPTYAIEEPDILAVIEERMAALDWEKQIENAKARVFEPRTGRALPTSAADDSYLVDLTVAVSRDIAAPSGEVFARAGESINPFDYLSVPTRYAFFDANSAAQRAVARGWQREHTQVTFISTLPVSDPAAREAVLTELGQPVHEINDALIERFQLRRVPALAYQEGRMLRVDVKGLREGTP
jgi:conjugal transfer pilus assembly protein TraW